MKTNGNAKIGNRIRRDLDGALSRLRQLGGVVMVMDRPGTIGESSPFADEVDQIQASASRDIGLATRELLQERANRLYSALDRLSVEGTEYAWSARGRLRRLDSRRPPRWRPAFGARPASSVSGAGPPRAIAECSRVATSKRRMKEPCRRIAVRLEESVKLARLRFLASPVVARSRCERA